MNDNTAPSLLDNASSELLTVQRLFPRVFLTELTRHLNPIAKMKVVWPSGFESDVFDFGRTSASVYFPMRLGLQFFKGDIVRLGWRLDGGTPFNIDCRVIRAESRLLTIELFRFQPSTLQKIVGFFSDECIASHMQVVPAEFFSPEQNFQDWFHGPQDTNLYVWRTHGVLTRVCLELREVIYVWDVHGLMVGPSRDSLSYATEDYAYFANFLAPLEPVDTSNEGVQHAVRILKQMQSQFPSLGEVISAFSGEKNG